jgi:hypothetical protein
MLINNDERNADTRPHQIAIISSAGAGRADTSSFDDAYFIPHLEVGGKTHVQSEIERTLDRLPRINDTKQTRRCWAVCDGMHRIQAMCQSALERKNKGDDDWMLDLFTHAIVIRRDTAEKASIAHLRNQTTQIVSHNSIADRLQLIRQMLRNFEEVYPTLLAQNKEAWRVDKVH